MAASHKITSRAMGQFTPPPVVLSLSINTDGDTLTGVATQDLTSADFTAGFTLTADGDPVAINSGSVIGNTVTWGIDTVLQDEECALVYDAGVGDVAGTAKPLASFTMEVSNGSTQTGGGVACAYPFDADEATVQGFGFNGRVPLSGGDQTFTYTIQSALGGSESYAAVPSVLGQLDASAGIVTFELPFTDPVFSGGAATPLLSQVYQFYTGGFTQEMVIGRIYRADGTKGLSVTLGGSSVYSNSDIAVGYIGVEMNADTGKVIIKADNVPLVLSADDYIPQALTPVFVAIEEASVPAPYLGQTASSSFRTNSDDYQGTYSVGALNACGDPV